MSAYSMRVPAKSWAARYGRSRSDDGLRSESFDPGEPVTPQDVNRVNFANARPTVTASLWSPPARNFANSPYASSSRGFACW